jgi:hypothetical protein
VPIEPGSPPKVAGPPKTIGAAGLISVDFSPDADRGDFLEWGAASYDVARDGRFLMVRPASSSASGRVLDIRLHWVEELKKINF